MRTIQLAAWAVLVSAPAHSHELPLSQLSGTWTGVQYTRATGQCRTDPGRDVELTLDVRDDGRIRVTDGRRYVGTGDVSPADWALTLVDEHAFAMCGTLERRYQRQYEGRFRRVGEELRLEFKAQDDACPPRCRFVVEFFATKRDSRPSPLPGTPAPRITDDEVRSRVILQQIADMHDQRGGGPRWVPEAYCIAVDPARDHGDPQPDAQRFYDPDLTSSSTFLKGSQDDPSPELLAAVRQVHPVARPTSACPTVEPMRPEWWKFPGYVVVRRIFELEDGLLKVPVLTYRPHSGCKQFAFYLAVPAADGWRIESPRVTQSLCH